MWALVLPNAIWTMNLLILISFFRGLPSSLFESAKLDGASEYTKQAIDRAGVHKQVIAVARHLNAYDKALFQEHDIQVKQADFLDESALNALPDAENIIFLAGRKFGTEGTEHLTWSANASMPTLVTRRFKAANMVAYSTGNIYPPVPPYTGGCLETTPTAPIGEYAMSSLARERIFEYSAQEYGTKVLILRLNFAINLRYGVLFDIAKTLLDREPVDLRSTAFNCVWQGYVNDVTLRALRHTSSPAKILNITGPEIVSTQYAATELARHLGVEANFVGTEVDTAFLNNAAECFQLFGYPQVTLREMIAWQAQWIVQGGRILDRPTHFEERGGQF